MKKILVLGSSGAGKSTFARRLHDILGVKLIHLDQYYWKPNWTRTEKEDWEKKVRELISGDEWIIDGNYRSTLDLRLPQADTIIWLDFPPLVCFWRIMKRRLKKNRTDELDGCQERISFELLKWILWTFPRVNRKDIWQRIKLNKNKKKFHIFNSDKQIEEFFMNLGLRPRKEKSSKGG